MHFYRYSCEHVKLLLFVLKIVSSNCLWILEYVNMQLAAQHSLWKVLVCLAAEVPPDKDLIKDQMTYELLNVRFYNWMLKYKQNSQFWVNVFSRVQEIMLNKNLSSIYFQYKQTYLFSVSYNDIMLHFFFSFFWGGNRVSEENLPLLTYLTSMKYQLSLHMSLDFLKEKLW